LLPVEKTCGSRLDRNARVLGREAQMMATLHSMADHSAAPTLSSGTRVRVIFLERVEISG
jgi:hypothetical protein